MTLDEKLFPLVSFQKHQSGLEAALYGAVIYRFSLNEPGRRSTQAAAAISKVHQIKTNFAAAVIAQIGLFANQILHSWWESSTANFLRSRDRQTANGISRFPTFACDSDILEDEYRR